MVRYSNPWHDVDRPEYGPLEYVTDVEPQHYRGFHIYNRMPEVFDVVQGGACVGQYAGFGGAVRDIDAYLDGTDIHYLVLPATAAEDAASQGLAP